MIYKLADLQYSVDPDMIPQNSILFQLIQINSIITNLFWYSKQSFVDWKPLNWYFGNSEDQGEMPHNVAFHQDLHCLLKQNQYSEKEIQYCSEIITFDP